MADTALNLHVAVAGQYAGIGLRVRSSEGGTSLVPLPEIRAKQAEPGLGTPR